MLWVHVRVCGETWKIFHHLSTLLPVIRSHGSRVGLHIQDRTTLLILLSLTVRAFFLFQLVTRIGNKGRKRKIKYFWSSGHIHVLRSKWTFRHKSVTCQNLIMYEVSWHCWSVKLFFAPLALKNKDSTNRYLASLLTNNVYHTEPSLDTKVLMQATVTCNFELSITGCGTVLQYLIEKPL